MPPLGAEEFQILAQFEPRFDRWWQQGPADTAKTRLRGIERQLDSAAANDLLGKLQHFHRLPEPLDVFEVELITSPSAGTRATHAEVRANLARVETLIDEPSSQRVGVVMHEAAHYLYAQTPIEQRKEIRTWFFAESSAWSIAAYNLFNEALASAFGNALVEETQMDAAAYQAYLALPESLYADPYVDRAAKAVLPLLKSYLQENRQIDQPFVSEYVDRVGQAMGSRITHLGFWLRQMVFVATSAESSKLIRVVARQIRTGALLQETLPRGCNEGCLLADYPELGGVIVTTLGQLDSMASQISSEARADIRRQVLRSGHSIYGIKRSNRSLLFVITADSTGALETALQQWLADGQIFVGELTS